MVQTCLGILPPVEDRVVFVAGRVARGAATIKVQNWRGCQHHAQVWELLDLTGALMGQDQRLMIPILQKNLFPEFSPGKTRKGIFHDTYMTRLGIASDMQVSEKNTFFL